MAITRGPAVGPDAVSWRIHREVALLAGWGRAILLQLAHPLVAQGVADHSSFLREPSGHVRRLRRTLGAMLALTFGSDEEADAAAAHINRIHDRVHGSVPLAADVAAGARYSAHDPALLAWVHVTLLDSFLVTYERFVAPLTPADRDRYCAESTRIGPLLGIPDERLPRTHAALRLAIEDGLAGEIEVGATARILAGAVLWPTIALPARPFTGLARFITIGLLPPSVRAAYSLCWTDRRETWLRALARVSRAAVPWIPPIARHWPSARRASRSR